MKKNTLRSLFALLTALVMAVCLLTGCGAADTEQVEAQEDAETIQVYLWTTALYDTYASYIQAQLPDVNIEFIVGNNDLDFYKFLQQNGGLPDIITCCRFSLHDAAPLKNSLMDLSTTNEAGAVYNTYLNSFKNEDGSVNWLPVCADAHGFVVNRSLFAQYDIPLPTDYASFVSACQAFEKVGIRGFTADYAYDYTCMETLQGLSAAELTTVIQGTKGYILQKSTANWCGGVTFHPNEGKEEHYNLTGGRPRQAAEFHAFARAIEGGDQELCSRMLDTSVAVSRVLTVARRSAGLKF